MKPPVARLVAGALLTVIAAAHGSAQTRPPRQRTYANPIDIDYRYNFEQKNEGISYRSGADPVIVVQRGDYYLFETIGDGYWQSHDLGTWHLSPAGADLSAADPDAHRAGDRTPGVLQSAHPPAAARPSARDRRRR